MAVPKSRAEFKEYCLRQLGKPVIEINISDDQAEDRIDEALSYFWDYHFDGVDKCFYKYTVQQKDLPQQLSEVVIGQAGSGYSNSDTITIYPDPVTGNYGETLTVPIATDSTGAITSINVASLYTANQQYNFRANPKYTINTSAGTGALLQPLNGGYVPLPDNVLGVVNLFPIGSALNTNNLFNIRYQIALNDLYTLSSVSMVPYYMAMQHVQFLEQMLVGQQPIRYNRHNNRAYLDMDWNIMNPGDTLILEAYQIVDPNIYSKVWSDRWLSKYTQALMKQQWGTNLTKFDGMVLPGGVKFNGTKIYNDATKVKEDLEKEMIYSYSLPVTDMIG